MSWVRRDDQASIHRKVAPLDDATYRLWSEAIEWCSRNQTDGHIGKDELPDVSKRASRTRAATLVARRLWHAAGEVCDSERCPPSGEDGWVVHDYLDYNPSRAEVRADLKAKAERTRKWRERKRTGDGVGDASRDASRAHHVTDTRRARDASPGDASPSRPVPPRPEGGGDGTSPERFVVAGSAARPDDEPRSTNGASPKCPRCMNSTTSRYHVQVCVPSEEMITP